MTGRDRPNCRQEDSLSGDQSMRQKDGGSITTRDIGKELVSSDVPDLSHGGAAYH